MTKSTTDHVVPNIIETMDDEKLFGPWFAGKSWDSWRCALKASTGLPLSGSERQLFQQIAGDRNPPKRPVREAWFAVGRRGGKDSATSLLAAHKAAFFDPKAAKLRRGERASVLCLACDREQAKIVLGYVKSFFRDISFLKRMVEREVADGLQLNNGIDIVVSTSDFRSVRGRAVALAIFDELSFWKAEHSSSPDVEVYNAIKPGTMTVGGMIIGISSPYKKSGLLYEKWRDYFGTDDGDVLVIRAPSLTMNPTLDASQIAAEIARDPAAGKAEWLAEWRDDLATFLDRALIETAVDAGVTVRPRVPNAKYH
jgi:hypothetical protein